MAIKKQKTNEQLFRKLLANLHNIEVAMLRERIQKIADLTRQDIEKDRSQYNSPFFCANDWLRLCDKIDQYLGTENKEPE